VVQRRNAGKIEAFFGSKPQATRGGFCATKTYLATLRFSFLSLPSILPPPAVLTPITYRNGKRRRMVYNVFLYISVLLGEGRAACCVGFSEAFP
jgi:hypothetical protein